MVLLNARKVLSDESRRLSLLDLRLTPDSVGLCWPPRPMRIAIDENELWEFCG
jgi:hypothetical protein